MDLYEALKAGNSADELLAKFQEELDAAQARIEEEENSEIEAAYLADCRTELALAFMDYIDAFCGDILDDEDGFTAEDIEQILLDFEKEIEEYLAFREVCGLDDEDEEDENEEEEEDADEEPVDIEITTCTINSDDDIIRAFLKSLK